MKRKIIFAIFAVLFFLGSITFYINTVAIPKYLKKAVLEETQKFLGRKITLQDLHFNPFQGFVLTGVTIFEKDSPDAFATVIEANVHFLYWPLIRERKVVLSSVELNAVFLNLVHYSADQWNFSDILERRSQTRKPSSKVYVSGLIIKNSRIKVTDLEDGHQFSDVFDHTDIRLGLSFTKGVVFDASTAIAGREGSFKTEGTYHPAQNKFSGNIKLKNFPLKSYLRLSRFSWPVAIDDVYINDVDIQMTIDKNIAAIQGAAAVSNIAMHNDVYSLSLQSLAISQIDFTSKDGEMRLSGASLVHGLKAALPGQTYSADGMHAQITSFSLNQGAFDVSGILTANKAIAEMTDRGTLKGDLNFKDIHISKGPSVLNITGSAEFKNTSLATAYILMKGDFVSPNFGFTKTADVTTGQGSLFANPFFYQWPTQKELTGAVALTDIRINANNNSPWTVQSNVNAKGLQIKLPGGKTLTTDGAGSSVLQYLADSQSFQIRNKYQLSNSTFKISEKLTLTGNPWGAVNVSSKTDPSQPLPYTGWVEFKDGTMQGTKIGPIEHMKGVVSFQNGELETSGLEFVALGMPAHLTGTLHDFSSPKLDVKVHINNFDLDVAQKIVPKILSKHQISLQGIAPSLDVSYTGPIDTTQDADIRFTSQVKDAVVTSASLGKTASNVSGSVSYRQKILSWKDLNGNYNGKTYQLTGEINPEPHPTVETTIEGDDLKISTRFTYVPGTISFERLSGLYKRAFLNVTGTTKSISGGARIMDFTGEAELDLKDLPALFANIPDGIRRCHLSGKTAVQGRFTGDLSHWQDWQFNLTGSAPQFSIWGLNLDQVKFNAVQKNNLLKPFHVWGDIYGGDLNLVASIDTAKKNLPLELVIRVLNSDLKKLRADTPLKKKEMSGILSATAILNGTMTNMTQLNGKGGIEVKDGLLGEIDLLKGIGGILLIPEYKDITFTQGGMNFTLLEGLMSTDNIELIGPSLNLYGKGTLDFNQGQTLDLLLSPDFNSDVIINSSSLKKGTTAIITQTEKFMSINVTGTLSKPEYKVNKSPVKILQKTGGVILENVSQFFQNIF